MYYCMLFDVDLLELVPPRPGIELRGQTPSSPLPTSSRTALLSSLLLSSLLSYSFAMRCTSKFLKLVRAGNGDVGTSGEHSSPANTWRMASRTRLPLLIIDEGLNCCCERGCDCGCACSAGASWGNRGDNDELAVCKLFSPLPSLSSWSSVIRVDVFCCWKCDFGVGDIDGMDSPALCGDAIVTTSPVALVVEYLENLAVGDWKRALSRKSCDEIVESNMSLSRASIQPSL
mmetsp:Transcript_16337/g.45283  ORF Transcript_16337/g.45283 Transcript_16337/m.45283 type:complete len:231 (+) Transcript_16337:31-723(+)